MTEIQVNPEYKIICTKKDNVEPWIMTSIPDVIALVLLPVILILTLFNLWFPLKEIIPLPSCGVLIQLFRGASVCMETEYRFTSNPEKDARKVKRIIDEFTQYGNTHLAENKEYQRRIEKEKQQCCNQYKEVMEKVKTE